MIEATVYYVASGWDAAGLLIVSILAIAPLVFAGVKLKAEHLVLEKPSSMLPWSGQACYAP